MVQASVAELLCYPIVKVLLDQNLMTDAGTSTVLLI